MFTTATVYQIPTTRTPNWVDLTAAGWNVHVESNNYIVADLDWRVLSTCFKNALR
jgi:hypothetical protein